MGLFKSRDKPKKAKNKYISEGAPTGSAFFFGGSSAGKTVNEFTAMQMTAVYACVKVLAETVASLPLHLYKITEKGKEKARQHCLYNILYSEPNPDMTSFVFRETMMSHLLLWGNAYAQIIRNGRGEVIALYPLLAERMKVDRSADGEIYYIYSKQSGGEVSLSRRDILHIAGLGFDGLVGYSPIAMSKNAIGIAMAAEEYGAKFYANGANPGGVLEHPGVVKDPARLRESWNNIYQGSGNSNKVAILEEGMTFKKITIPPEEAQFLQTRKFQLEEICRIYRVPPHLVGDLEKATFSNIEHQSIDFVVHTVRPWLVRFEQALHKSLLLPFEKNQYFFSYNVDGLLRGDYQSRMQGYAIGRQNGFLSANDIRSLENMNPIPQEEGGDAYLVNGNMISITQAATNKKEDIKKDGKKENAEK